MSALPILGPEGFVSDPNIMMSRLLAHSFEADYSQSNVYSGTVASMHYLVSIHSKDPAALEDAVQRTYKRYYERYFDDVTVQFTATNLDDQTDSKLSFDLNIEGYLDNVRYSIGQSLQIDQSAGTVAFIETQTN